MTQTRVTIIVGAVLAVLIVAVLVVALMILNGQPPASPEDEFWSCMSALGFDPDTTLSDAGKTVEEFRAATAQCEAD